MSEILERVEKAIGEVAANTHEDVRHVLSPAAIERVARAVLMAVRSHDLPSWAHFEQEAWRDGIDAILNDGGDQ